MPDRKYTESHKYASIALHIAFCLIKNINTIAINGSMAPAIIVEFRPNVRMELAE